MSLFNKFMIVLLACCGMSWTASSYSNLATETSNTQKIKEFGLLKNVEDSGYPFFTLTIEFPERGFTEYFSINVEEVKSVNAKTLSAAVGKYVSFEYNSTITNALIDLRLTGNSLLNEGEAMQFSEETKTVTGILSNAAEATTGDTPGELYIVTEEEITYKFPFFITPKIVTANGKTVVGFYVEQTSNVITALQVK
jgi:hypothetical protein